MYLRFQTKRLDPHSGRPRGFLVAAYDLLRGGALSKDSRSWLRECLKVFEKQLRVPTALRQRGHKAAISWFRAESPMVDRVWDLVALLEEHGVFIDVVRTDDPGITIYEDDHQVVAKPKRDQAGTSRL